MTTLGVRQARAQLPALIEAGEPVTITRHGRPVAAILPAAAAEVWQRHQEAEAARARARAEEETLGGRLPGKRTPVCPRCGSSFLHVVYSGQIIGALVNTADPDAGVQAVVVDADPAMLDAACDVRCASCWESMGTRPRRHGWPARQAAGDIADEKPWPKGGTWEIGEVLSVDSEATRSARIVVAHDIARGVLVRCTRWEALTGILDSERDQMRADMLARGQDPDSTLDW